jgi:protein-arginine kinase activator protein McsA
MSQKENDIIVEELKEQLDTAIDLKDWERAKEINERIYELVGYKVDYDIFLEVEPNYED